MDTTHTTNRRRRNNSTPFTAAPDRAPADMPKLAARRSRNARIAAGEARANVDTGRTAPTIVSDMAYAAPVVADNGNTVTVSLRYLVARPVHVIAHRRTAGAVYALAAAAEALSGDAGWCVVAHAHDGDHAGRVQLELGTGSKAEQVAAVATLTAAIAQIAAEGR